jgi:hypothetical protein
MGAWAAVASAISTSSSSSSLSSDSSLSDELSFLSLVTPGSGSELSSEDSSPELDSGLATTFAGEVLVVDAFVVAFVVTGLVGASSEAEDSSSDDSSSFDDASLDSSLELDAAAPVPFVGGAFTARASVGTGLVFAVFVPTVPLAVALGRAAFAGAALAAGFDDSSSDSPLSESSSLSLSLTAFAEALVRAVFEGTGFGIALVTPALVVAALFVGSSSDSLSLDSEEEPVLGGGALDYMGD